VADNRRVARPIVLYGDPVLHRPCAPVESFDDDLGRLVDDLFASMYAADGVGLAANQIGVALRVFVYDCPGPGDGRRAGHIVNPVRISRTPVTRLLTDEEGCLSIPGQHADVARAARTTVVGVDRHGERITVTGTGLLARCLQHEVDHLDGTLYVDRLPAGRRRAILDAAGLSRRG
jgi:peptide deformylase